MKAEAILEKVAKRVSSVTGRISGDDLRARCARGGVTLSFGVGLERGLQLVRYIILTRLLAPDEFGLMAIVFSAMLIFETAFEVGVRYSVIQNKRGGEPEYLNVAWWFQVVRGLALFTVAYLAAPMVGGFYGKAELSALLRVALIVLIFKSLMSPGVYVLEKRIKFSKVVVLTQGSSLFGTFLTIGLVFFLRNVWALIMGFVGEAFLRCLLSFILCPFRPRLHIDRSCLGEIMRFARGMFGLSVLAMVAFEIDILVLGKVVSMALVGIYLMAKRLAQTPKEVYVRILGPILLSAFSERQDDKRYLRGSVLKMTKATALFGMPLAGFCFVCAGAILSVVFGGQYAGAAVPFGLLSICTLVRIQGITLASVYLALGRPHLHRGFVALRAIILVCLIYPAIIFWGPIGAASIVLFAEIVSLFFQAFWMQKRTGLELSEYLFAWLPGLGLAQIVVVPNLTLKFFGPISVMTDLVTGVLLCLVSCGLGVLLLKGGLRKLGSARTKLGEVQRDFEVRAKYA